VPTYEYQCKRCEAVYDLQESFSAPTTHRCKECKRGTAKRVLHAPRILFKGSGFYVTDSKNRDSAVSESDSNSKKSEPKTETKTESKSSDSASSSDSTATAAS